MWSAEDQELSERRTLPSRNMASNSALAIASRSGASRRGRQVTSVARYSPDVVDSIMADFALDSGWRSEVREFGEEAVDWCAASDGLDAGDQSAGGLGRYGQ
jgi:hypothetical protein